MAVKIVLCVSSDNASVAVSQRGRLTDLRQFGNDRQGWSAFEAYVRRRSRATVSIMADSIDEDYRIEKLPHASSGDRRQLIARKLRQLFRGTQFASAALQDRIVGRRREDQYLFAAITRPELLAPWLRVVNALKVPVAGIYLLPVVALSAIGGLKLKQTNLLLVSKNESGLRQTFCKDLKMQVSRLTPTRDDDQHNTTFYSEEINSTRMYLDALTLTHVDDVLTVLILDQDGSLAELPNAIARERPNMKCVRLDPAELEENLGTQATDMASCADALHLQLLTAARPAMNLAPPTLKTRLQVHVVGKFIYAAAMATVAFGVLWAVVDGVGVVRGEGEAARLAQEMTSYQTRYQEVTEHFPETPASSQVLRDSVEAAKRIDAHRRSPRPLLLLLGAALTHSPNIGLGRVEWIYGSPDNMPSGPQLVDFTPNLVNGVAQIGIISAEVQSYEGDNRAALTAIRAFVRRIAEDERVAQVGVLRLPLDLDPTNGLDGSTASQQGSASAPFQIAVVLRPEAPSQ
jgi:hypothetical protein